MNRKKKILAGALTAALLMALLTITAFATSGDVAGRGNAALSFFNTGGCSWTTN